MALARATIANSRTRLAAAYNRAMVRTVAWLVPVLVAATAWGCGGGDDAADPDAGADAAAAVDATPITGGPLDPAVLHEIAIDIAVADLELLDGDQTVRVPCDVRWDGTLVAGSGCRKKGSAGSVDSVLGKPALSIKFDEFVAGQTLGAFDKLLLNNALQDPSLLHEHVAYEVFRALGVPAHRTAYALVTLNGEPRGVYVVVEPVDKEFLRDRFGAGNGGGNLYESLSADFAVAPDGMDLKDEGGRSRDDLLAVAAAVEQTPDGAFAATVGALIDLDEVVRFVAAEIALDAEDGFSFGRNNYYLYHRPDTDRFVMLPHGQDVILASAGLEPDYPPAALLAARARALPALSALIDAALAQAAAPGGALDATLIAARIDAAVALVTATDRDDDFTVGDLTTMRREGPVVAAQLAWRAALLRGETAAPTCGDGVVHGGEQCDDGGTADGDGCDAACRPECVEIIGAGATWRLCPAAQDRAAADAACAVGGGALVVPADPAEAAALARLVRRHLGSADVWLGVSDAVTEGVWLTDAGAPVPYLGFAGREPTGDTDENCAVLDTGSAGSWRDQPCDVGYPALCRLP